MAAELSGPLDREPADFDLEVESLPHHQDAAQEDAVHALAEFFSDHGDQVFYGKQLEVLFETQYFHWVTNRAYRELTARGLVLDERRSLTSGVEMQIMWDRRYRYPRRAVERLAALINEYMHPDFSRALGHNGEQLIGAGFTRTVSSFSAGERRVRM